MTATFTEIDKNSPPSDSKLSQGNRTYYILDTNDCSVLTFQYLAKARIFSQRKKIVIMHNILGHLLHKNDIELTILHKLPKTQNYYFPCTCLRRRNISEDTIQ